MENYSSHTENDFTVLDDQMKSDLAQRLSSWQALGFDDQILHHENGFVFNLSSIDLDSVNFYYEYESSNSTTTDHELMPVGRPVALAAFVLIFIVGLIGNSLVVYIFSRHATMRRVTFLYFLNLSLSNLLYLLVCLPSLSVSYAFVNWKFGRTFCKLENYIMSVSMSVSVMTIVAAALDRYMVTVYLEKSRTIRTTRKTMFVLGCIWILSCAIMAPRIIIFEETLVFHIIETTTVCSRDASSTILKIDTGLNFLCLYVIPLLVVCVCHCRNVCKLRKCTSPEITRNGELGTVIRDKRKTTNMIFSCTVAYAIGWLPMHVYHLFEDFDEGNVLFGEYIDRGIVFLLFSFGANAFNPIFYCLFSSSFRKRFKEAFKCCTSKCFTTDTTDEMTSMGAKLKQKMEHDHRRSPIFLSCTKTHHSDPSLNAKEKNTPTKSSSSPYLEPLLLKRWESRNSNCKSLLHGRPESWPSVKERINIQALACSCVTRITVTED